MSETATTAPEGDGLLLDLLVPPPGPRSRRLVRWAVFAAVLVLATAAWVTGTVTPRLDGPQVSAWGGTGPVFVAVTLANGSPVDIEVTGGPRPRPGLRARGTEVSVVDDAPAGPLAPPGPPALGADPFPVRLRPGEEVVVTAWFEVVDCDAVAGLRDDQGVDLRVRMADGPFSVVTRTRSIPFFGFEGQSWPVAMARRACGLPPG